MLWAAAQRWVVQASTLVGFIVLGRLLNAADFGTVALAMTFIGILTTVTDAGYALYLLRVKELTRLNTSTAFWISSGLGLVLTLVLASISGVIADALNTPKLALVLVFLSIPLFIAGLSSVPAALLERDLRFRELAVRQTVATGVSIVVAIVAAACGAGLWALVAQHLTRAVLAAVTLWIASDFRPTRDLSWSEGWAMTSYGLKSMGVRLGTQLRDQGELFLIGALAGTVALGYWTVAGRLVDAIVGLTSAAFFMVGVPLFAKLQDDPARLSRALSNAMAMAGIILVAPLAFIAATAPTLIPLVFGNHWAAAAVLAGLLAMRSLASSLSDFLRMVLSAVGRAGVELLLTLGLLVVQLGLVIALAHDRHGAGHGLVPLAISLMALMVLSWPLRAAIARHYMGVPWGTYGDVVAVVFCGAVAGVTVALLRLTGVLDGWPELIVLGLVGGLLYAALLWLLRRPLVLQAVGMLRRRGAPRGQSGDQAVAVAPATEDGSDGEQDLDEPVVQRAEEELRTGDEETAAGHGTIA